MSGQALFLPWIQLDKPIKIGDVTFHPFSDALSAAGHRRAQLQSFGSIYIDGYILALSMERGEPIPRLRPTIVFVADDDEFAQHARDAVEVLMLATILENGISQANGATFYNVVRWLDGEADFIVDVTPKMRGRRLNGIGASTYFHMKPPHTGEFHHLRKQAMVDALWAAVNGTSADEFREIFDTFHTATSESPDVSPELAESLMAKAATLLTHRHGMPDQKGPMLKRLRSLLTAFVTESTTDEFGYHIARVWQAVRDHRNDFWHPERRGGNIFPFSDQTLVAPLVIALRMVHALIAARLIELNYASADGDLADDIVAIEHWIATLVSSLDDGLEALTGVELMMERKSRAENVEEQFTKLRWNAHIDHAISRHMAHSNYES